MELQELALQRLSSQRLDQSQDSTPENVLSWMVAVQAQDYSGGKWSLGLRLPASTDASIETAIQKHKIIRSWLMRGTLHFAASAEVLGLLELFGKNIIAGNKRRYGELELDERLLSRSSKIIVKALESSGPLTRRELLARLNKSDISTSGQRGIYMLQRASLEALICQGTVRANNPEFILLEGFPSKKVCREKALSELAMRYYSSRGPATLQDFGWWSGLRMAEVRQALEQAKPGLEHETIDGKDYWFKEPASTTVNSQERALLLPGFDEYLLAYKDRSASLGTPNFNRSVPANGSLPGTIVIDGQVKGTWKRTLNKGKLLVSLDPFKPFTAREQKTLPSAVKRLGEFLGLEITLVDNSGSSARG